MPESIVRAQQFQISVEHRLYQHNLYPLRLFVQLTRTQNVSELAKGLDVPAKSVSNHLKALERRYGKLYEQDVDGLRLNERGLQVLKTAERIFAELAELQQEVAATVKIPLRGILTLAAPADVAAFLLASRLGQFQETHPEVDLRLSVMPELACQRAAQEGTHQLAVTSELPVLGSAFHVEKALWTRMRFQFYSRPRAEIQDAQIPWAKRLAGTHLLIQERGSAEREITDSALRKWFGSFRSVQEIASSQAIRELVIAGLGVGYLPACLVQRELQEGLLAAVEFAGGDKSQPLVLLRKQAIHYSPLEQELWEFLLETA